MRKRERDSVAAFCLELARAYPNVTMAEASSLMLAARALKAHPEDVDEVSSRLLQSVGVTWGMEKDNRGLFVVAESEGGESLRYYSVPSV